MIDATKLPAASSERTQAAPTGAAAGVTGDDNASPSIKQPSYPAKAMVLQQGRYYATDEKK